MAPHSNSRDSWASGEVPGSRRLQALFADTEEWIERLKTDAHWARTPEIRTELTEKARILQDLLEEAR